MNKKIREKVKSSYDDASSGEGIIAAQTQEKAPYARKIKLVVKRNGKIQKYNIKKIKKGVAAAYGDAGQEIPSNLYRRFNYYLDKFDDKFDDDKIHVEDLQDVIEYFLMKENPDVAKAYILFRADRKKTREYVAKKKAYVENYKHQQNTADATIDDNSNVKGKNIGILNAEIHKADNVEISREMIMDKLEDLFPEKDSKQYLRDLLSHIIYKNDESNFAFAGSPYCVAATMYPFILNGIKDLGGLSAAPKNIDSFCGMYVNLVFALSAQFAGAVALPETLLYFTYFCKKEWGDDFWKRPEEVISGPGCRRVKTIRYQIRQYWQSMIYGVNQPAAARGMQSAFTNFAYFDHPFFDAMFGEFVFPDGTRPDWESLDWIQREFMQWFNDERLRTILTFPVESFSLIYKDGRFEDEETARFVAEEYARGHSFFTYISDTVDSLSSCCFVGKEVMKTYDENGFSYITIQDFVDSINNEINESGVNIETGFKIEGYDSSCNSRGLVPITGVLKKNYTGKLYKFDIGGKSIEVTADHIMMVRTEDGVIHELPAEIVAENINEYEIAVEN